MTQDNPTGVSKPMDVSDILKQLEVNEGTFPREALPGAYLCPVFAGTVSRVTSVSADCAIFSQRQGKSSWI
jgi:hypothetical protein